MAHAHSTDDCPLQRLAESGLGNVALCQDCGAVHLTVQSLTVRLEPRAFLELAGMTLQARQQLLQIARGVDAAEARH